MRTELIKADGNGVFKLLPQARLITLPTCCNCGNYAPYCKCGRPPQSRT